MDYSSTPTPSFVRPLAPPEDKLQKVRDRVSELREINAEIASLEERVKGLNKKRNELVRRELPELFNTVGISHLGIESKGNLPALKVQKKPFVHANIPASWDDEKKDSAYTYLQGHNAGDLIKSEIIITLGLKTDKLRRKVLDVLNKADITYKMRMSVPWGSLTSWLKEEISQKRFHEFDVIGADVGEIVEITEIEK